jgi:hypothetical protein
MPAARLVSHPMTYSIVSIAFAVVPALAIALDLSQPD